jgi:hypothetical protein
MNGFAELNHRAQNGPSIIGVTMRTSTDLAVPQTSSSQQFFRHMAITELLAGTDLPPLGRCMTHLALPSNTEITADIKIMTSVFKSQRDTLLERLELNNPKNKELFSSPNKDPEAYWTLCSTVLKALGHDQSSPLYDYALCLHIFHDVPNALAHWGIGSNSLFASYPRLQVLKTFCASVKNDLTRFVTESGSIEAALLLERASALMLPAAQWRTSTLVEKRAVFAMEVATNLPGASIAEITRKAAKLNNEARDADVPPWRQKLQDDRIADERSAKRQRTTPLHKMEESAIAALKAAFMVKVNGPSSAAPTEAVITIWGETLRSMLPHSDELIRQALFDYSGAILSAVKRTQEQSGSYEGAFVDKMRQMLEQAARRAQK